jgi:predicted transcriptional regulator
MDPRYKTLATIFTITKDDPQPTTYKCRPRDLILRQFQDWSVIQQHIQQLEAEGLVMMRQEDTLVIQITAMGIEKIVEGAIATA